jgi:hypothetical protein
MTESGGAVVSQKRKSRNLVCDMAMIALAAVGVGGVGLGLYSIRPRDPVFEVQAITLSGFNLRFCTDSPLLLAVVDVSLTLFIKVINPNVTPIQFSSTIMDIYYKGNLLGQAQVCACFVCFRCYCYCRYCFCLRLARLIGFGAAVSELLLSILSSSYVPDEELFMFEKPSGQGICSR